MFASVIIQTGSPALALIKKSNLSVEERGDIEECVVLPQDNIYHHDNKKSAESLNLVKKEFEEVVSIVAKKHDFTIIQIVYTEPNEYRDPVSGCVSYSFRGQNKIHKSGTRE